MTNGNSVRLSLDNDTKSAALAARSPRHARELAGDGKTEASAAEPLRGRGIGLGELLEQLRLLLRAHGHSRQANLGRFAVAERFCGTIDRHDPAGVRRPPGRVRGGTPASGPHQVRGLL